MSSTTFFPESDVSEWKWSWRDEYMKWLAAFANTSGGTLYIGVNDDGYVVGLKDCQNLMEELPNKCRDKLHITPNVRLCWAEDAGANIRYPESVPEEVASKAINRYACGNFVPESEKQKIMLATWEKEIPVCHDQDGRRYYIEISVAHYPNLVTYNGVAYTRSGSTLQILEGQELERAVLQSTGLTWDAFDATGRIFSDLDPVALAVFRKKAVEKKRLVPESVSVSDTMLVEKLGLLSGKGRLTRAAAMLFSNPEKVVAGSYIKLGFFAPDGTYGENTIHDVIYHDDVRGPLLLQADKVIDLLYAKYLKALISYNGLQRVESYMIPQDAMREIILNAIAHKYYPSGNPIQIKVYDDHVTVMNEGFWPFDKLKVEDAYNAEHSSYRSNPLIAEGLYMAGDIETWGSGFEKIRKACARYGTPLPEIEATTGSVTIYIRPAQTYLEVLNKGKTQVPNSTVDARAVAHAHMKDILSDALKEREKKIVLPLVDYFEEHDSISSADAAALIQMSVATATRYLRKMVELGVLVKKGRSYNTLYCLDRK